MVLLIRPSLCHVSWLLRCSSLLLSVCSSGVESAGAHGAGVKGPGAPSPVNGIRGGSVCFHVVLEPRDKLGEITWMFTSGSSPTYMLRIQRGQEHAPTWFGLQDKYMQRVHVPDIMSLRIESLTREDSGLYRALVLFTNGTGITQTFPLSVYESVTPPEILIESQSSTTDLCSVTLLCRVTGPMEDLSVTWDSKDLPRELDLRGTQGPDMHSWTLTVSLPRNQPNSSVSCVASNPVDWKVATKYLGEPCGLGPDSQKRAVLSQVIPGIIMVVLLVLVAGLMLWKRRGKRKDRMKAGRGAALQEDQGAYMELMLKGIQESPYEVISTTCLEEQQPVKNNIYSEIHSHDW